MIALSPRLAAADAPFQGWLSVGSAYVHARPDSASPIVGLLRSGDLVTITQCEPSCDAPKAWAWLGADGAIRLSLLQRSPEDERHRALSAAARYVYGTVRAEGTPVYSEPRAGSAVLHRLKAGRVLAFEVQELGTDPAWLPCSQGGFVSAGQIRLAKPSTFTGLHNPTAVTAFTLRRTVLALPAGAVGPPRPIARHSAWDVLVVDGTVVRTSSGSLRRDDVRLAVSRRRPAGIPLEARWVAVDLNEQTLVAYEGDRPVLATLVSSGKKGHETPEGLFSVWLKTIHHTMNGTPREPYEVDEVPFAMFFNRSDALHGAFWHDQFGSVVSHGCVNLSVEDARWLFDWSPPALPAGWHAAVPGPGHRETLRVLIEKAPKLRRWEAPPTPTAPLNALR